MRLAILERVLLGGMLAAHKDSFLILKQVREAREALSFSDEEAVKLKLVTLGDQVQWNAETANSMGEVDIKLAESTLKIIKQALKSLNDNSQLTDQHFTLYEKFVVAEIT